MNAIVFGRDKGEKSEDFYLLGRYICQGILFICFHITFSIVYYFYFLFVGSGRNECIVFGRDKGEKSEDFYLLGRYICQGILFICFHITFSIVFYFYFLLVGSRRKECNSFWGEIREEIRRLLLTRKVIS